MILATEWEDFKNLNYKENGNLMKDMNFIDGRNFLNKEEMINYGFNYLGIGR